jgi:hypothetical protein
VQTKDFISSADLGHALQMGSRPHFYRDMFMRKEIESLVELHCLGDQCSNVLKGFENVNHDLLDILYDITSVSKILEARLTKFEPYDFQEIIISILYRLLHLYPLADCVPTTQVDRLCFLVLLSFMSTMVFQPSLHEKLQYKLLTEKLHLSLMETSTFPLVDETVMFWILYIGAMSGLRYNNMTWLKPRIKTISSSLGIHDWFGARETLCSYPWIAVFHDPPAQELWSQINGT